MSLNTILATTPLTSTNYVLKATGTTIGNSLIFDNGTNVGIGNTNTSYTLDVSGTLRTTGSAYFALTSGTLSVGMTTGTGRMFVKQTSAFLYEGLNVYALSNDSFVGIGHTGSLAVVNSSYNSTGSYCPLTFNTSDTERMRITSGGNILLGTTDVPNGTSIYGSAFVPVSLGRVRLAMATSDAGNVQIAQFFNPNGQVGNISTNGLLTVYGTSSDYRLKKDVTPMENALSKVNLLKPYTWKWKDDSNGQGFIAHELQEHFPEAVTGKKDGLDEDGNPEYQSLDASFLVATLTKAIQEQQALITSLQEQINELKNK